jgi:hypothetical protein
MVYVQDVSTNGTFLTTSFGTDSQCSRRKIALKDFKDGILLNDGDELELSSKVHLTFYEIVKPTLMVFNEVLKNEREVSYRSLLRIHAIWIVAKLARGNIETIYHHQTQAW